jgi:hypothetical protein
MAVFQTMVTELHFFCVVLEVRGENSSKGGKKYPFAVSRERILCLDGLKGKYCV